MMGHTASLPLETLILIFPATTCAFSNSLQRSGLSHAGLDNYQLHTLNTYTRTIRSFPNKTSCIKLQDEMEK